MHHDFFYQDYEFQDYPAEQPLPERSSREQYVLEYAWKAAYQKYPREDNYLDPLRRLMHVAYGAHPLFGAQGTLRLTGYIRISHHAESEFEAMTLASDTFARYGFTVAEAALCAKHAADCAKLAGKPKQVVAAWSAQAKKLRAHGKRSK
ncbi:MAG: hypothetical protein RLZ70_1777 [Verrucomicrobiota bacterium]